MRTAQKQDESPSRSAAISSTTQSICGSQGIRHTTTGRSQVTEDAETF